MSATRTTAIILAAGQGKRMQSTVHKQYLLLRDKPVLYYALKAFQDSIVDNIIVVCGKNEETFCTRQIIEPYGFNKVKAVVEGGIERYHSVANGLFAIQWDCEYVFIHDGARPFVTTEMIKKAYDEVVQTNTCVVGMPVKDTIKIADADEYVVSTPARSLTWQIQTPQVFNKSLITTAYQKLLSAQDQLSKQGVVITDDAMVVEYFMEIPVKLIRGSYENIKITTPEDLKIAEIFLERDSNFSSN